MIVQNLRILGDLIESVLNENTQTKKLCYDCVKEYIELALWLFPIYIHDVVICEELFAFFHVTFDVLKAQMGARAVEEIIQTFISLFRRERLVERALHEGGVGVRAVEKFLRILEFVIKEPTPAFRKFVPSTISLCMQEIYPLVREVSSFKNQL